MPDVPKRWDSLFVGWFASYKRPWLFGARTPASGGARKLAVGKADVDEESLRLAAQLAQEGVEVRSEVPYASLAELYNSALEVHVPTTVEGGGERAVLEARACGAPLFGPYIAALQPR